MGNTKPLGLFSFLIGCCFLMGIQGALAAEPTPLEQLRNPQKETGPLTVRSGVLPGDFTLDGRLTEPSWKTTESIDQLTMVMPKEGNAPSAQTIVRVMSDATHIVIGVQCFDPEPSKIVSNSVARDAELYAEDNIKIVLDTFGDGRSGYIFQVNPSGARYDALIADRGEEENANWNGIWEAKTHRDEQGWSAEIRIPVNILSFKKDLNHWLFNIERRIQRNMEVDRWSGFKQDYTVTQTIHGGSLTDLPHFDLGLGTSAKPSLVMGLGSQAYGEAAEFTDDFSVDITQKLGSNILASMTVNTDFAETEVDDFQTNLTRFSLYIPEKRSFFLEGGEVFSFGLGIEEDAIPFYSRRIGLVGDTAVPLWLGGKINGQVGGTSFGAIVTKMKGTDTVDETNLGVIRLRQNVLEESSVGLIATFGDPEGRKDSWTLGADFTYQTSKLFGDKNFLAGVWGLAMDRADPVIAGQGLSNSDPIAFGGKIDFPNDLIDAKLVFKHIGTTFDPSLGFVPRWGINSYTAGIEYQPRLNGERIRQMFYELEGTLITNLNNTWETYQLRASPLGILFESGEMIFFTIQWDGENLFEGFDIAEDVAIPAGTYDWSRYSLFFETASKRKLIAEGSWNFGDFYNGTLQTIELELAWNPIPLLSFRIEGEKNFVKLPGGEFTEDVYQANVRINISPDLMLSSIVQYENEDHLLGTNSKIRWSITPSSNLYLIYNHNWADYYDETAEESNRRGWRRGSFESKVKIDYTFQF